MAGSQAAVAQLAAMGYMNGGMNPTLQLLTSGNPGQFLSQASTVEEVDNQAGLRLSTLQREQLAAATGAGGRHPGDRHRQRADEADQQQGLPDQRQDGRPPELGDVGRGGRLRQDRELPQLPAAERQHRGRDRAAGGADPPGRPVRLGGGRADVEFDCSGLVVWAFAQEGISLPHYTGDLWNLGVHVSEADLEPGDLVFFFGEDHVGIYIGDGLMVDAPAPGQDVMVQPITEDPYDGAVRIS